MYILCNGHSAMRNKRSEKSPLLISCYIAIKKKQKKFLYFLKSIINTYQVVKKIKNFKRLRSSKLAKYVRKINVFFFGLIAIKASVFIKNN